ncbi:MULTISPECIES: hypothetical protein [Aeromonas]|uniref:hypothetical protein n=1 Tax=Aeromonas TaxID=642 RepID=UPI0029724CA6|nr:hypothetical protein [Aeromonas rivipollensis]
MEQWRVPAMRADADIERAFSLFYPVSDGRGAMIRHPADSPFGLLLHGVLPLPRPLGAFSPVTGPRVLLYPAENLHYCD